MPISRKRFAPNRGVSQQPRDLRYEGQVEASDNFHVNNLNTLCKRFGSAFVAKLPNAINSATCAYHIVNYGAGSTQKFLLEFNPSTDGATTTTRFLRAWNMDTGAQLAVTAPAAMAYVSGGSPLTDLRLVTVGDDSYVLNITKTPAMAADVPATDSGRAFVFLRKGDYSAEYTLKVRAKTGAVTSDVITTVKTWDGRLVNNAPAQTGVTAYPSPVPMQFLGSVRTEDIIEQLIINLNAKLALLAGVTSGVGSYVITNPGVGYTSAPTPTVAGGGGSGATCNITVEGGRIVLVTPSVLGSGYTYGFNNISYTIALSGSPVTKAARLAVVTSSTGAVVQVHVLDVGSGYTTGTGVGAVTISAATGSGFTGTWNGTLANGNYGLASVNITAAGTLYPTSPYVSLAGGGFSVAGTVAGVIVPTQIYAERIKTVVGGANNIEHDPYMGSIMAIRVSAGGGFTIEGITCSDSVGDTALIPIFERVPRVQGYLPEICEHDTALEVVGDAEIEQDNYWIKFVADEGSGAIGKGYWLESNKPGAAEFYKLDPATMPHKITINAAGTTLTYAPVAWGDRNVGEVATVPNPSIVGTTLNDIGVYRDRLCFINKTSIVMSESGAHTNIWRTTLLQLLDSDPIDLDVATSQGSALRSLVTTTQGLFLFTETSQFVLRGTDVLSPRTVEVPHVGSYENKFANGVRPVSTGGSVAFPVSEGAYSGINQLIITQEGLRFAKLTAAVPQYIPGDISAIAESVVNGVIVFKGSTSNVLYIYRYQNAGNKLLTAWYKWTLPTGTIRQIACISDKLYIAFSNNHSTPELCIETISLTKDPSTLNYLERFALASTMSPSYSAGTGLTTFTLPWNYSTADIINAVHVTAGTVYSVTKVSTPTITMLGDFTGTASSIIVGINMTASLTLTKPAFAGDVMQRVRGLNVSYSQAAMINVRSTIGSRAAVANVVADGTAAYNPALQTTYSLLSATEIVPLWGDPEKMSVVIDSTLPMPCTIPAVEWALVAYQKRG